MNSLKFKILGLVSLIIVVIISATGFIEYNLQKKMITRISEKSAIMLSGTIQSSIENVMRSGRSEEVTGILAKIKSFESIGDLRIFDETGMILNSADKREIGKSVDKEDLDAFKQSINRMMLIPGKGMFQSITPIYNKPACYGCHDASKQILGILEIEFSTNQLQGFLDKGKLISIGSTTIIILSIIFTLSVFLIAYVDKPIRAIISSMQRVEHGDFDVKIPKSNSTEMQILSDNFNLMTEKLKYYMNSTINHERELARAQEKLSHHHEIHLLNQRLEEQLKEIEALNIGMEERIEDIEEANFKIADLAGELEDKNTTLETAVSRLSTLYKVGLAINSTMDTDRVFNLIVKMSAEAMGAQIGYIILYDQGSPFLRVTAMHGHAYDSSSNSVIDMKPSSVSTWVIENHKPLLISDINEAPQFDRFSALGYERKSLICAPLTIKDEIIGTITVVNKVDNSTFTNEDLELITTIATQASIAIKNSRLYEEQQRTYLNTIHALVSAIEASDSYTRGHSERVTRYSMALAKKLNLPPERLKIIERAAILHDIGKIGIDLALLHKVEKLNASDISDLQQHPAIGMKILEPIEFLKDVRVCIGQHHERYDGTGYPNNVPACDLLLESRILAIADAYDAMTSDRPYRKALHKDRAIKELIENSGHQFDPALVPHFIEILEKSSHIDVVQTTEQSEETRNSDRKIVAFNPSLRHSHN